MTFSKGTKFKFRFQGVVWRAVIKKINDKSDIIISIDDADKKKWKSLSKGGGDPDNLSVTSEFLKKKVT